jgi:DsbC/DsbD-like thiol-disulfide interchange protein
MLFWRRPVATPLLAGLLLLLASGGAAPLYAQNEENPVGELQEQFEADSTLPSSSADLVSVETRLARTPVPVGESVRAAVVLTVEEGWHVNAHRPTYDYLIGTALDWSSASGLRVDNVEYPRPKRLPLDFAGDVIDVYEGSAPIFFDVRPADGAARGERRLTGRLRVQACNDKTCLRPSTVRASLPVPVAPAGANAEPTGDPIFEEAASTSMMGTLMPILRRHGFLIAGGVLVLGTVLVLLLVSAYGTPEEQD